MDFILRVFIVAGVYSVISCSTDPLPVDCNKSDLMLELVQVGSASGCGVADGSVTVLATGGTTSYQYAISNNSFQTSGEFKNLMPGIYTFVVRDKSNCEALLTNITVMAADISFSADVVENTKCVGGNGAITINMTGGTPPFQYKIGAEAFDNTNTFSGLESGNYLITVIDNADCTTELNINVSQGITNTSWQTEILPIIQNSCATTGCHNGVARADLRVYANAKTYATLIKTYTQNGYMPFEGTITPGEKDKIACWVDEGALEN